LKVSSGAHVVLPAPSQKLQLGVLIPKTRDKRVLFVLPWLDHVLVGTTDVEASLTDNPKASEAEMAFIKQEYENYFEGTVTSENVLSSWAGLRPLVNEPVQKGTALLSRDHSFDESPSGLLSIFGGKWTTYRLMAQDTVDKLQLRFSKPLSPCMTDRTPLKGAEHFSPALESSLIQSGLSPKVAQHLTRSYGDEAQKILKMGSVELLYACHPMLSS